jgi:predicted nucleic acid-binding protein
MIVADTGPLMAFARIGQLGLLRRVVGTLHIPEAVYNELLRPGRERPGATEIVHGGWIQRHTVSNETAIAQLPSTLHHGERHAIVLAQELSAALLIDEQRGRTIAQAQGLTVIGSLWVLATAKQRGDLEHVKPFITALLAAGYWLDELLLAPFLQSVGEHNE